MKPTFVVSKQMKPDKVDFETNFNWIKLVSKHKMWSLLNQYYKKMINR